MSSNLTRRRFGATDIVLKQGDITREEVDAIVNAANSRLAGGGGVDGAIHQAGGRDIMRECDAIRARQGGCPTGEAVITRAGRLAARHVVHTVGPVWQGGGAQEPQLLASAYRNSLAVAARHGLRTIAFPAISTGVFGFPARRAASIAGVRLAARFVPDEQLPVYLAAADAVVLPSRREGLPVVVLEAFALERPVIATRVGGTPEALADGATGVLVEPGDSPAIAGAVGRLLTDASLASHLGRAARARIADRYSVRRMVRATEDVYLELLERKKRRRLPSAAC